jgi:uncharacterized protein (DUF2062 family)
MIMIIPGFQSSLSYSNLHAYSEAVLATTSEQARAYAAGQVSSVFPLVGFASLFAATVGALGL